MLKTIKIIVVSSLAGCSFAAVLLWVSSIHRHIPSDWGRVYLSSECEFSHQALRVVQSTSDRQPIAAIPLDVGSLMLPACRHTQELLIQDNHAWQILRVIPDDLVCRLLVADGSQWFYSNVKDVAWPAFSGPGGIKVGANPNGFAAAGLDITSEELDRYRSANDPLSQ